MPRIVIVGAGLSGLATAHFLRRLMPEAALTLLERAARPGGKVRTWERDGYRLEGGPNGFVSNAPDTLDLVADLGLAGELLPASEAARRRYLFVDGGLRPLPTTPQALLRSELLSLPGKLRAVAELLLARRGSSEETVHDFIARHFGHEAARALAGPLVLGVAAGDARQLSLDALFPTLRALERSHGSLLRAVLARQRSGGDPGRLTSFRGGIDRLITALADDAGGVLRCGVAATSLDGSDAAGVAELRLTLASDEQLSCDALVLAGPADVSAELLRTRAPVAAAELAAIPYAGVRVLGLGFERIDVPHALDGFGFLVPRGQGVRTLGVLWSTTLFPERAPAGRVLLRAIAGGAVDPEFMTLTDNDALEQVRRDLRLTLGVTVAPTFSQQVAWRRGIPQYLPGHRERIARARAALPPGVYLTGDAYDGIGLNDCVAAARRVATEVAARLRAGSASA